MKHKTVTYDSDEIADFYVEVRYLCYNIQAFVADRHLKNCATNILTVLNRLPTQDNTLKDLHDHYLALLKQKGDLEYKGILYNALLKRNRKRKKRRTRPWQE